jgi:serine/threonine-protein kinase
MTEARRFGRTEIIERIDGGGMGEVFFGCLRGAAGFARPVVVKRIADSMGRDGRAAALFEREARTLAGLVHPHIVSVLDFDRDRCGDWMVLEYIRGLNLSDLLRYAARRQIRPSVEWGACVAVQGLRGLAHAHGLRDPDGNPTPVVHRDVTPSNLMLDAHGVVKVVDFGIAKPLNEQDSETTSPGSFRGKAAYLAPEVLRGGPITPRVDVYAMGLVLRRMWVSKTELRGATEAETLRRAAAPQLRDIRTIRPDVPERIARVVDRATAPEPADRYPDAGAFLAALLEVDPAGFVQPDLGRLVRDALDDPELPDLLKKTTPRKLEAAWRRALSDGPSRSEPSPEAGGEDTPRSWPDGAPASEPLELPPEDDPLPPDPMAPMYDPEQGVVGVSTKEPPEDGAGSFDRGAPRAAPGSLRLDGPSGLELDVEPAPTPEPARAGRARRKLPWLAAIGLFLLAVAAGFWAEQLWTWGP